MSIQKKAYFSKKLNKMTYKYYAVVHDKTSNRTVWSKSFESMEEAKICEGELLKKLMEGQKLMHNTKARFDDVLEQWLEDCRNKYANSTFQAYKWYCKKYLNPVFSGKSLSKMTSEVIQRFTDMFSSRYSSETTNKCLNILSDIFKFAIKRKIVFHNPVLDVERKKVKLREVQTWREEHIKDFLSFDKVKESPYYELLALSFSTGLRPSEVCGLADWMLKGNTLHIERGYDQYNAISNLKTARSHRRLTLSSELVDMLMHRLKRQSLESQKEGYIDNDFLFKQVTGRPVNPHSYSQAFKRLLHQYNLSHVDKLPDVTLYEATRHSFGTNMTVYHQQPTSIVSSIMGNSERVLQTRYIHPDDEAKAQTLPTYCNNILSK